MRILSQDGMIDVPYEQVVVQISNNGDNSIIVYTNAELVDYLIMARYSTEVKAKRAMEMLHTAYAGRFITNADIPEDFNEQLKELMKSGFGTVLVKETNDSKIEFNNLNGYFQFPADDELEE